MNEWIEKARGGDASAMDYLIDKYREIGNEKEAAYWQAYRDAADSAIASMNRLSEIAETAEAAMALGLFDAAEEGFEKALPICRELLKIETARIAIFRIPNAKTFKKHIGRSAGITPLSSIFNMKIMRASSKCSRKPIAPTANR